MRSKNAIIMKMGRSYLSGSGFHHSMDLHDKMKSEKDEKIAPNQGNFGKIIGTKKYIDGSDDDKLTLIKLTLF